MQHKINSKFAMKRAHQIMKTNEGMQWKTCLSAAWKEIKAGNRRATLVQFVTHQ